MSTVKIYKISKGALDKAKKVLEASEEQEVEGERKIVINEFARTGYTMRDSKMLGFAEGYNYLYIKADEEFFKKNDDKLKIEGIEELSGEEYEKVKEGFEKEASAEAEGIGSVFKDF